MGWREYACHPEPHRHGIATMGGAPTPRRSSASAIHHAFTSGCTLHVAIAQSPIVRSLAVCAARDDTHFTTRKLSLSLLPDESS
jgi:hypothetical protein